MLSIEQATYKGDYSIHLVFSNGKEGIANLEETVLGDKRSIFSRLQDLPNFQQFRIEHSTVTWSDELDLAPEYLFYLAFQKETTLQEQFREWGYIA